MLHPIPAGPARHSGLLASLAIDEDCPVETYNDRLGQVCGMFRAEPCDRRSGIVRGTVQHRQVARFDAALVALDAQRVARDARMIRRDPGEHLFLLYQHEGHCTVTQGERRVRLLPGDLFIADSTLPSDFDYRGAGSRQVSLHVPRDEAVRRLGRGCTGGTGIDRSDPLFPALQGVMSNLLLGGTDAAALPLGEALLNILTAYFHAHARAAGPGERKQDMLYLAALRRIAARAADPDFDIGGLAADLGLSRRSLQRLFERNGDTVSARLLAARLDRAWTRLNGAAPEPIAAIAYDCGFNDLSYFYRVFRARFGEAPGRLRKVN